MVLTVDDLQKITLLINTGLGNLKDHVDEKFSEAFRLFPTKEEFFSRMDELMHEVKPCVKNKPCIRVSMTDWMAA